MCISLVAANTLVSPTWFTEWVISTTNWRSAVTSVANTTTELELVTTSAHLETTQITTTGSFVTQDISLNQYDVLE